MQLPSIDRNPSMRPAGVELASSGANKVIPVAPVNPSVSASPSLESTPGVVNMVNMAKKPNEGEALYTSVSDPAQRGSEAATSPKDWTVRRPAPEKVEDPPKKPIAQMLIEHLRAMWAASAVAAQLEQVKDQVTPPIPTSPNAMPGELARESLTYTPSKIKKTANL